MDDLLKRGQFGNFRLDYLLGMGSSARVYRGEDTTLGRQVAVKIIDAELTASLGKKESFLEQARALVPWRHKNIVRVYHAGTDGQFFYLVMEYVDGIDLSEVIEKYAEEGELIPHDDVVEVGRGIALALDFSHKQGVLHKDVKPGNVLMGRDGRVLLADFGLSGGRVAATSRIAGTAHYIAPEQAAGGPLGIAADVYSLGVVMYEMLVGTIPFDDPSPVKIALQHINLQPPNPRQLNPSLNSATDAVLLKVLRKEPDKRYATAGQLIDALEEALAFQIVAPVRPLPPPPAGVHMRMMRLSQKSMIERVITHMEVVPSGSENDRLTRKALQQAINRLTEWGQD